MTAPSSTPAPDGAGFSDPAARIPSLAEVRAALRSPDVPLPPPAGVAAAAHRVRDLVHAERFSEARYLAETFCDQPAGAEARFALLQAQLEALAASGQLEPWATAASRLVAHLRRTGHGEQAAASAELIGERIARSERSGGHGGAGEARTGEAAAAGPGAARPGRR
ncbi:hypothetical protein ACFFF6_19800, partial [Brachybacterium hainanense]